MKITGAATAGLPAIPSSKPQDPPQKPRKQPRRRIKNSGAGVRLRKDVGGGGSQGRRSRPETPLLHWKFNEGVEGDNACGVVADEVSPPENRRKFQRKHRDAVSVRRLAAGLWRLQLPEVNSNGVEKLGFQAGVHHLSVPFHGHHHCKVHDSTLKDQVQSPRSVSGKRDGFLSKLEPSFQFSNTAMEGATKWDPIGWKAAEETKQIRGPQKRRDQQAHTPRVISVLEAELEQARARIQELETERKSSKKKLEQFLKKLSEERAVWRSREHEKIRAILDDLKAELKREMKNRQRLEIVNSKLVNELADAKVSVKRYMQDLEKEQKARELIEEVCDELAKEIGEDKAEIEALKRESAKLHEEVDDERKMLQMAEVWREERVQMKLVDAKVTLEDKYSQMNQLIVELESFLRSRGVTLDMEEMKKVDQLRQAASHMNIHDIQEFKYEPPNPGDIFSVLEDVYFAEVNEKDIEASEVHTISQDNVSTLNKPNFPSHCNEYVAQSELDEEGTEWETISHLDEQGSSYSPGASDHSLNKNCQLSDGDGKPVVDISEVCPIPIPNQQLKMSSISRLWRSRPSNGQNYKIISLEGIKGGRYSNGRPSNGAIMSPELGSGKGGLSPSEQWSSPDSGHPHLTRGMKGCIEWPRNSQKSSLKSKLLEARMESQKFQLRHVLKQKI
nr:eukaryotic translation initiation factor 5B-like isoform X1 [Ipomoea batatas]